MPVIPGRASSARTRNPEVVRGLIPGKGSRPGMTAVFTDYSPTFASIASISASDSPKW
jgi:hypothetical protein